MNLADTLIRRFTEDHPAEAARLLGDHPPAGGAALLARLDDAGAAGVLARMSPPAGAGCLAALDPSRATAILSLLPPERAAALLRRLDAAGREALLRALPGAARLRPLLVHAEGTAAALMDPAAIALPDDLDLDEARRRLHRHAAQIALEVYVVDRDQRLRGVVSLREVLDPARRGALLALARPVEPLTAGADTAAVAAHPGLQEQDSLPVVDERGVYLGAVRHDRLRQQQGARGARRARGGVEAVGALGELYWLGLSGLFTGLASSGGRGASGRERS
jgi:Mg/Co/Ni transporter MgtE